MEADNLTCLVIGDPHFKTDNLRYATQMIEKVWQLNQTKNPDFVVMLGDTLHTHEKINVFAQKTATDFIARLSSDVPVFLLIGNHDRPHNDHYLTDIHPFTGLEYAATSLEIVNKGLVETIKGRQLVFIPYVPNGRFDEAISSLGLDPEHLDEVAMIFAHQEFKGAKMGGIISEVGDVWPLDRPPVISGHIHDFDKLQHNLIYTGTPFQHAFGDRDDKTVSFITFTKTGFDHERISLGLPVRRTFRMSPNKATTFKPPIVDDPALVRIVITGTHGEVKALIKTGFTEAWSKAGYKVSFKYLKSDAVTDPLNVSAGSVDIATQLAAMRSTVSYRTALLNQISSDDQQLRWFNKLFGTNIVIVGS